MRGGPAPSLLERQSLGLDERLGVVVPHGDPLFEFLRQAAPPAGVRDHALEAITGILFPATLIARIASLVDSGRRA